MRPELEIYGVCGPRMRELGVKEFAAMEAFQTFIVSPRLYWEGRKIRKAVLDLQPDICVFIDASYFSLKMAEGLRRSGYDGKIIKYVCPATWWPDHGRKEKLEKLFDALITIFPHERDHFKGSSLTVHYVGHPLFQRVQIPPFEKGGILALFPGSRPIEIKWGIRQLLQACVLFQQKHPEMLIEVSCAASYLRARIEKAVAKYAHARIQIVDTQTLFGRAQIALAKPGTNNLELAQHGIATLIAYPIPAFARWFILNIWKLKRPRHAMINFVYGEEVFPEMLLNEKFCAKKAAHILENLDKPRIQDECVRLSKRLQNPHPSKDAAQIVVDMLSS